ncbi:hypothetical protein PInf_013676 [Phytophthora infestans]|nr:hypothetical protein PInf_013676 [Phytophthora infestans]
MSLQDWGPHEAGAALQIWKKKLRKSFGAVGINAGKQPVSRPIVQDEDPSTISLPQIPQRHDRTPPIKRGAERSVFGTTEASPYFQDSHMVTPRSVSRVQRVYAGNEGSFGRRGGTRVSKGGAGRRQVDSDGSSSDDDILVRTFDEEDHQVKLMRPMNELATLNDVDPTPRIEMASHRPFGRIKPFSGSRNKSENCMQWLRGFVYEMTATCTDADKWSIPFELSLRDGAIHWFHQLPKKTKRKWELLSDAFTRYYCSQLTKTALSRYYSAKRERNEHLCDYINRLNGYAQNARIHFENSGRDAKEHVQQFLATCDDNKLAESLYHTRVTDIHELEEVIKDVPKGKGRMAKRGSEYRHSKSRDARRDDAYARNNRRDDRHRDGNRNKPSVTLIKVTVIELNAVRGRDCHMEAQVLYAEEVKAIREDVEVAIIHAADHVKEVLAVIDSGIREAKVVLTNNELLLASDADKILGMWSELDAVCQHRTDEIEQFAAGLEEIEQARIRRIRGRLQRLTYVLMETAHALPPEVERIIEAEAYEVNTIVISNRRVFADLVARLETANVDIFLDARLAWERGQTHPEERRLVLEQIRVFQEKLHIEQRLAVLQQSKEAGASPTSDQVAPFSKTARGRAPGLCGTASVRALEPAISDFKRNWTDITILALVRAWRAVYRSGRAKDEKTTMFNERIFVAYQAAVPSTQRSKKAIEDKLQGLREMYRFIMTRILEELSCTQQIEEENNQFFLSELMQLDESKGDAAKALREALRLELHGFGSMAKEGAIQEAKAALVMLLSDDSMKDLFRAAGGLKSELDTLAKQLNTADLIYNTNLEPVVSSVGVLLSALPLTNVMEKQGKEAGRKAVQSTLEKVRKATKGEIMSLLPSLQSQISMLTNLEGMSDKFQAELGDISVQLDTILRENGSVQGTGASIPAPISMNPVNSSMGTANEKRSLSEAAPASKTTSVPNAVAIRKMQRRLGMLLYASELDVPWQEHLHFIAEQLELQTNANRIVDEIISRECDPQIDTRQQKGRILVDEMGKRMEQQSAQLYDHVEKLAKFFLRVVRCLEESVDKVQYVNLSVMDLLDTLKEDDEDTLADLETKFTQSCTRLRHLPTTNVLREEFQRSSDLLLLIEGEYRTYDKRVSLAAGNNVAAIATQRLLYLERLCDLFGLKQLHQTKSDEVLNVDHFLSAQHIEEMLKPISQEKGKRIVEAWTGEAAHPVSNGDSVYTKDTP